MSTTIPQAQPDPSVESTNALVYWYAKGPVRPGIEFQVFFNGQLYPVLVIEVLNRSILQNLWSKLKDRKFQLEKEKMGNNLAESLGLSYQETHHDSTGEPVRDFLTLQIGINQQKLLVKEGLKRELLLQASLDLIRSRETEADRPQISSVDQSSHQAESQPNPVIDSRKWDDQNIVGKNKFSRDTHIKTTCSEPATRTSAVNEITSESNRRSTKSDYLVLCERMWFIAVEIQRQDHKLLLLLKIKREKELKAVGQNLFTVKEQAQDTGSRSRLARAYATIAEKKKELEICTSRMRYLVQLRMNELTVKSSPPLLSPAQRLSVIVAPQTLVCAPNDQEQMQELGCQIKLGELNQSPVNQNALKVLEHSDRVGKQRINTDVSLSDDIEKLKKQLDVQNTQMLKLNADKLNLIDSYTKKVAWLQLQLKKQKNEYDESLRQLHVAPTVQNPMDKKLVQWKADITKDIARKLTCAQEKGVRSKVELRDQRAAITHLTLSLSHASTSNQELLSKISFLKDKLTGLENQTSFYKRAFVEQTDLMTGTSEEKESYLSESRSDTGHYDCLNGRNAGSGHRMNDLRGKSDHEDVVRSHAKRCSDGCVEGNWVTHDGANCHRCEQSYGCCKSLVLKVPRIQPESIPEDRQSRDGVSVTDDEGDLQNVSAFADQEERCTFGSGGQSKKRRNEY